MWLNAIKSIFNGSFDVLFILSLYKKLTSSNLLGDGSTIARVEALWSTVDI